VQTYTTDATIDDFRDDFRHRAGVCRAAGAKHGELRPVADECLTVVTGIDAKQAELRRAQDLLIDAGAEEAAQKLDVLEVYAKTRKQFVVDDEDKLFDFLPDAPSSVSRYGLEKLTWYMGQVIKNLQNLAPDHPVRVVYLPRLETEFGELKTADVAEDEVRSSLMAIRAGLNAYKADLARIRDGQLGKILAIYSDRTMLELFTLRWRSDSKSKAGAAGGETTPAATPA
jgi:hypothetical protein